MYHIGDVSNYSYDFNPELYTSLNGGGAVGLDERIKADVEYKHHEGGHVSIAMIKKSQLNLGPYQRNLDTNRLNKISEGMFYNAIGHVLVHEVQHDNSWYYNIVDGQHRANANPSDKCVCIISNTIPEPVLFAIANDPKAKKSTSAQDNFHAEQHIIGSIPRRITEIFEEHFNVKLQRSPWHGSGKRGRRKSEGDCGYANYGHNLKKMWDMCYERIETDSQGIYDHEKLTELTEKSFINICKSIFSIWNMEDFNSNGSSASSSSYMTCMVRLMDRYGLLDSSEAEMSTVVEKLKSRPVFKRGKAGIQLYDDNYQILPLKEWVDTAVHSFAKKTNARRENKNDSLIKLFENVIQNYDKKHSETE